MRTRTFAVLSVLVVVAMLLGACAQPAATPAQPTAAPVVQATAAPQATTAPAAGKTIKVGLVTDTGGVNDKSFNQSAWAGVQKAVKDLGGVEAKFIESKQPTDYEKNIDQFATENYDVIITVGFLMGNATAAKVPQYLEGQLRHHRQRLLPDQGCQALR